MTLTLQVATLPRLPDFPADDEPLGRAVLERLLARLRRGRVAPTLIVLYPDRALALDLRPILAVVRTPVELHRHVAAFAGMPGVEAVGVVGLLRRRVRPADGDAGPDAPELVAGAFLEWSDGRWWCAIRPVDEDARPMPTDVDGVTRAVDGAARPGGLGGWFGRARFEGLRAHLSPRGGPADGGGVGGMVN